MKYLAYILIFASLGARAQGCFKMVNGVQIPCTQAEIDQRAADQAAFVADSANNGKRARFEQKILNREDRLIRVVTLMAVRLNDNQFSNFIQATRNERSDYPYVPDGLITWFTTAFPTRNYYDAALQTRVLNILQ